jgi:DNA-binding transcriptional LysR family regulator
LEQKLNAQLFYRVPKGVILTSDGEFLFQYIEQWYGIIETSEKKFLELKNIEVGQIRIAVCSAICKYHLMNYLEEFCLEYPNIKISIQDKSSEEIVESLKQGKVDIGMVNLNIDYKDSLKIIKTFKTQDCFVMGKTFKDKLNKKLSLKELTEQYPIILLEQGGSTRIAIDNYFASHQVECLPQVELSNLDLLIEFTKRGLGISCVVKEYVQKELEQKQLFEIPVREKIPERILGIGVLNDFPLSTATQELIKIISQNDN